MAEVGKYITELASMLFGFASMSTSGWVAAALFSIMVTVGGFFLARWARKYRIDEAARKTAEGRSKSSADTANEGRETEQDSTDAANEIDRLGRKP